MKLRLQYIRLLNARIRIVPFPGRNPAQDKQTHGHSDVAHAQVHPHFIGERRHEGEQYRRLFHWLAIENRDAQVHKGHRKIDGTFTLRGYGQVGNGQVSALKGSNSRFIKSSTSY